MGLTLRFSRFGPKKIADVGGATCIFLPRLPLDRYGWLDKALKIEISQDKICITKDGDLPKEEPKK